MILCEWTPDGGSMIRISDMDRPLTHQWYNHIKSLSSIKFALASVTGGYAKPKFSDLQLWPKMFESNWPPPDSAEVVIKWTEDTEANAITLFEGSAGLDSFDRHAVTYTLTMPEFDETIIDGTSYTSTDLEGFLTTLCTALSLSTDFTEARATSPDVSFSVENDIQAIDLMSDVCEWFGHGFKIIGSTLYLFDMLGSLTPISMDEFDFSQSSYRKHTPISLLVRGNKSVSGSSPNGEQIEFDKNYGLAADALTHLGNLKTLYEKDIIELNCMMTDARPQILEDFTTYDESTIQPTSFTGKAVSVIYNFDTEKVQIEGMGAVS